MQALRASAQVVIVGGGLAGAATAWALCRRGLRDIVVVEKESSWGYHASGRNAAMCRQLVEDERVCDFTVAGAEFLRSPPEGFSSLPLLRRCGSVLACAELRELDEMVTRARARGLDHECVGPDAVRVRWPELAALPLAGALLVRDDGIIDVHELLQCFVRGARAAGAQLLLDTELVEFGRGDTGIVASTSRGPIRTRCVVNAAGAWAQRVGERAGEGAALIRPMKRHLFVSEADPSRDLGAPFVWYLGPDELYYRPEGQGLLLSACEEREMEPHDARPDVGAREMLAEKMSRAAPALAELRIARSWACLRSFTADRRFLVDWDPRHEWLFWVAGLGGHGATASAAVGQVAAQRIAERLGE
jgi:glycine/D-amino acid oxidase-like deaminating enzyme